MSKVRDIKPHLTGQAALLLLTSVNCLTALNAIALLVKWFRMGQCSVRSKSVAHFQAPAQLARLAAVLQLLISSSIQTITHTRTLTNTLTLT